MYATEIIIPAYILKTIGLIMSILALYSYYKLQVLKKPPGRLIFIQLIFLFIMQLNEFIDLVLNHIQGSRFDCQVTDYISIAAYTVCSLYEVCIAFEVLIRIKTSPMGQNYTTRQAIYHFLCILGGSVLLIIAVLNNPSCNYEFVLNGDSNE